MYENGADSEEHSAKHAVVDAGGFVGAGETAGVCRGVDEVFEASVVEGNVRLEVFGHAGGEVF
jgi:hypothetical protein